MHMLTKYLLFSALVVCAVAVTWDASSHNVQAELLRKWKSLGVQYCQTFPELSPLPPNYAPLIELINQFASNISQLVDSTGVPSLTTNLVYDQDILWTQGYGLKDLSKPSAGAPDGDTMYQIGSNSKLFTTLLALIAQDKGLLSFTDEVASHVPEFAPVNPFPSVRRINFAQLASHMAGLPRESPCFALEGSCNVTNAVMWDRLQNVTLVNPPGFIPQYSNAGFAVLGHVVEEIMGGEWEDLIQQEILGPLGMSNTGSGLTEQFLSGRAIGYTEGNAVAELLDIGWEAPAGAMYSTTNDMAKFLSFFFRDDVAYMTQPNQILDSLSIREWRQPRYINDDSTGFGLPWEIFASPIIYTKGGAINGYLSLTVSVPQLKLGMSILQSSDAVATLNEVFGLWATSFIQPFAQILQDISPAPIIPPIFNSFVGTYNIANMTNLTIMVAKTEYYPLPLIVADGINLILKYVSDTVYKMSTQGIAMSCETAQGGYEQYIVFTPSTPPTFTIPGLFPGMVAIKIA